MSTNYTGPVTIVRFDGPRDSFVHMFLVNVDDTDAIEKIVARFAEDGYKPDIKSVRKAYMSNGTLEERARGNLGFRSASAHLRVA